MNIDERLEALAQSVELLTLDIHEMQAAEKDRAKVQKERDAKIDRLHADMMLAIARFASYFLAQKSLVEERRPKPADF